jgi:hypothetical protein
MKKQIALLIGYIVSGTLSLKACEACGCDASSRIYPSDFNKFIGIGYSVNHFRGRHSSTEMHEYFNRMDIYTKWALNKRLEIIANLPYMIYINSSEGTVDNNIQGIGDLALITRYAIINKTGINYATRLVLGAGIEAPTGKNNVKNSVGDIIQPLQPGSNSWDYTFNVNYGVKNIKYGMNADVNYKLHTKSPDGFKRPNILSANIDFVKYITTTNFKFIPKLSIGLERTYAARSNNDSTLAFIANRTFVTTGLGFDVLYKKVFAGISYRLPVYQNELTNQQLKNTQRIQFSIGWII